MKLKDWNRPSNELMAERKALKKGKFAGVQLDKDTITYEKATYTLPAKATVETAGQIGERFTATRLALLGPFGLAFKQKKDNRELYLTVEGDGWMFVANCPPQYGTVARKFAAAINSGGRVSQ